MHDSRLPEGLLATLSAAPKDRDGAWEGAMLSNEKLNRRQVLMGATAGALGIGAAALSPMTAMAADSSSLVGTWDVWITDQTGPGEPTTFEGATTFAPGGGVVTMDSNGPSTGIGSWAKKSGRSFTGRFMQFGFSPQGTSKVLVSIKGTLSEHDSISGTFTFKVYDLQGNQFPVEGKGIFTGTRFSAG